MYQKRWDAVKKELGKSRAGAFVVSNPHNIRYLCCAHLYTAAPPSCLVLTRKGGPYALTSWLESNRTEHECEVQEYRVWGNLPRKKSYAKKSPLALARLLKELGTKSVLADKDPGVPGVRFTGSPFIENLRAVKEPSELELIKKAVAIADFGADELPDIVNDCTTELEAANELDYALRARGAQAIAFPTIIAAGGHSAYPHHDNGESPVKNTSVICDFGVYVGGYCSDVTRTILNGRVDPRLVEVYHAVQDSVAAGVKALKPGVPLKDVDAACRNLLRERHLDLYFIHSTGHGIGLEIHENPYASPSSKDVAKKGMVITIEPGVYIPGLGGVRLENDILVTAGGAQVLNRSRYRI